ncbi:uncharacterized protein LOC100904070 [Galendromus occidentalis]|uniref:Uncharacterized protein LOC100904070 n=1 Tax=Galendromus occidentalis TaxID=34638 RepID=A0AAJ6QNT2_9ACAR|nr:uncharacterized protein LOC100904070 [Galendromus occidentalis]
MRRFLVLFLVVCARAAPLEDGAASSSTTASVDLKKPTADPKIGHSGSANMGATTPSQDLPPDANGNNAVGSYAINEHAGKGFLLPAYGVASAFGGYRGLNGNHGLYSNLPRLGNFGQYGNLLRGYGAFDLGGGGLPVNIGIPGPHFG